MPFRNPITSLNGSLVVPQLQSPDYNYVDTAHITGWKLDKTGLLDAGDIRTSNIRTATEWAYAFPSDPELANGFSSKTLQLYNMINPHWPIKTFTDNTPYNSLAAGVNTLMIEQNVYPGFAPWQLSSVQSVPKMYWEVEVDCQIYLRSKVANASWIKLGLNVDGVSVDNGAYMQTTQLNEIAVLRSSWTIGNTALCQYLVPTPLAAAIMVQMYARANVAAQYQILGFTTNKMTVKEFRVWNWN